MEFLKSTGVIRRIDDLGRIVIPKEIRRNLLIRDGENIEIFVDIDSIILKKYSKLDDVVTNIEKLCMIINSVTNYNVIVTDRDHIISVCGQLFEDLKQHDISGELIEILDNRETIDNNSYEELLVTKKERRSGFFYITSIISSADSIGLIILNSDKPFETDVKVLGKIISKIICEQVDIN